MGDLINRSDAIPGDLISRADAVKAIRKCKFESVMPSDWYRGMECAQDIVEELPSADAEWIPCSERLPKAEDMYQPPEQRYLCQLEAHGMRKFCVLSRLKGAAPPFWDWYGIAVYDSEVIAWMPLPKPYREDGEV